jgi:hypothetical protein
MTLISDDSFHEPDAARLWWTETSMFSFDVPRLNLSAIIYPYVRPNLNVATLHVCVWDDTGIEQREVRYAFSRWHLPMPTTDLTGLQIEGLRYRMIEPMRVYEVSYEDPGRLSLDLRYQGLREPHVEFAARGRGHVDQPCRVTGVAVLDGARIDIDGYAMRDRSWLNRPDDVRDVQLAYTFGIAGPLESFLLVSAGQSDDAWTFRGGFLVRDGVYSRLSAGSRRPARSSDHHPVAVEIELTDELGRELTGSGLTRNRMAYPTTAGMFAWMSLVEWRVDGQTYFGEDQEAWSYDLFQRTRTAARASR